MIEPRSSPSGSRPSHSRERTQLALDAIRSGGMVILTDDENAVAEGALVMAGDPITADSVNFMATHARGLVCVALTPERIRQLGLSMMPARNRGPATPAFTVSVEARRGVTTGISAADRARTIQVTADDHARPEDLITPGHVFPVCAAEGGVLVRSGHAEAAIDLVTLAGLKPVGVTCAILGDDGRMARTPMLRTLSEQHDLPLLSVADLIAWRLVHERLVEEVARATLATDLAGRVEVRVFTNSVNQLHYLTLVKGTIDPDQPTLVRVHSSDVWGDAFTALRKDGGVLLHRALELIAESPSGVVLYILKPFTAAALVRKLMSHADSLTTTLPEKPEPSTYPSSLRDYGLGAQVLRELGLGKLRLVTHNPELRPVGLEGFGLEIVDLVSTQSPAP